MATYRVPVLRDFAWQPPVDDRVTAPTEVETKGTRYLVIATGSGIFTGKENHVMTAAQDNPTLIGHWIDDTPVEGWTTWVKDENAWYVFDGVNWNKESIDILQSQVLVAESEISNASVRITAVDSQLLLIESEAASNDSEILLLESEVSNASVRITAIDSQLLLIESEAASNDSEILLLESECATNASAIATKQSQASYIAAYGCLEFIV